MLTERNDMLIKNAFVLPFDTKTEEGVADILVRNGVIESIKPGLNAPDGVEVIDATDMVAIPGFIDTHWHLWNSLLRGTVGDAPGYDYFSVKRGLASHLDNEDFYWSARFALAAAALNGITSVHNWDHNVRGADDVDANLQAQLDSGLRGRFSYGPRDSAPATEEMSFDGFDAAQKRWPHERLDGRIHFGVALRGPYRTSTRIAQSEWAQARARKLPITMHCDRCLREPDCRSCGLTRLDHEGLLGSDVQIVHAVHASTDDIAAVARNKTTISVSPLSEMRTMGFPLVTEFVEADVVTSLSIDTLAMPTNVDVLGTLRALMSTEHARTGRATVTPRVALEMATIVAAQDLGIDDVTGSLRPGKRADMVLIDRTHPSMLPDGDPIEGLIYHGSSAAISTVICDGRLLVHTGELTQESARLALRTANDRRNDLIHKARTAGTWE